MFAHYDVWLALFGAATAVVLWLLPKFAPWFFKTVGHRVSEPETKFVSLILLSLGGLSQVAGSEAVLPAYLIGMALAPSFLKDRELGHRFRIIAFTILTPFYFLKAGSLVEFSAVASSAGLIAVFLFIKMATKFAGILPLTKRFNFEPREGMYTTLLMSTGLTFGSISALFGLTNHIIDQREYTILVTAVIGSAVVPDADRTDMVHANAKAAGCSGGRWRRRRMFKKILIANDGSEGAARALSAAIELAKEHEAELHMISVEELPRYPASIDEVVEEKARGQPRLRGAS